MRAGRQVWKQAVLIARLSSVVMVMPLIAGCAVVDQFGSRAVQYNDQAAVTKNSMILLNVMRAAHSEPLQFSDMTTVSGTSTLSGTASAAIPAYLNPAAGLAPRSASVSPSGTATGSATVNVANLNSQEFYKGLQTPLTMQQIAYYMLNAPNGLTPSQLLPLVIAEIEVTSADGRHKAVLKNNARNPDSFHAFYSALNEMIINGLSVEPLGRKPAENVGPPLSEEQARDPKFLSALVSAEGAIAANSSDASGLTLKLLRERSGDVEALYQLQKDGGNAGYRFCFKRTEQPFPGVDLLFVSSPRTDRIPVSLGRSYGVPIAPLSVRIGRDYYCGSKSRPAASGSGQRAAEGLRIATRSLEGMYFYLGEIVRAELGLVEERGVTPMQVPVRVISNGKPIDTLLRYFAVERRLPAWGEPSTTFRGDAYTINVDPSGDRDTSSRILQLLTDLTALQSSAKSLPAPNFIAITSQ